MADTVGEKDQGKEAGPERKRAGRRTEVAADKAAEAASDAARAGAAAMRQGMQTEQATERGMEAAGSTARRSMETAGEGARALIENTADHVGEMSQQMVEAAQQATEDLRTLMILPSVAASGLQEIQQAMTGMLNRVIEVNVRAMQEVLRYANPGAIAELQQRCARQYRHGLIEGSAEVLRASRQLADSALKPIEERTQHLRQHGSSGRPGAGTVSEVMTEDVEVASPDQSVQDAAELMAEVDTGALPVGEEDQLVGMITDRDIAVRVIAAGKNPKETRVREIMTPGIRYCFEDEDVGHVAENMADQQVRRLPVVNRDKRLVGVVSLGDIATRHSAQMSGAARRGVSQPGGQPQAAYAGDKPGRRR